MDENHYKGTIKFQKRTYVIEELHNKENIVGKFCFGVEVPGVNHQAKVFVIGVRGYDNEPNNDDKDTKRPAVFESKEDCVEFMSELYFSDSPLRLVEITDEIYQRDIFPTLGAYLVRKPLIQL